MNNFFAYRPRLSLKAGLKVLLTAVLTACFLLMAQAGSAQTNDDTDTSYTTETEAPQDVPGVATEKNTIPEPLVYRKVPDSIAQKLKKEKDFAYANDAGYWVKDPPPKQQRDFWDYFYNFFQGTAIRTIAYSLLIAFFLFVIYRIIVVNKLFLFYSSKKIKKQAGEDEAINIDDENIDEKIQSAVDHKDNRMAVRYMYLKALKLLNDRQWIHFHAEATNYEYVNEMSKHKLGDDFRFLTRVYDYMWYGEFTLTNEQFEIVYNNFKHFYNAVNS